MRRECWSPEREGHGVRRAAALRLRTHLRSPGRKFSHRRKAVSADHSRSLCEEFEKAGLDLIEDQGPSDQFQPSPRPQFHENVGLSPTKLPNLLDFPRGAWGRLGAILPIISRPHSLPPGQPSPQDELSWHKPYVLRAPGSSQFGRNRQRRPSARSQRPTRVPSRTTRRSNVKSRDVRSRYRVRFRFALASHVQSTCGASACGSPSPRSGGCARA